MANGNGSALTKAELQDRLDSVQDLLDDAYQVESSREDMAQAISQALDILHEGEEEEEEEEEEDEDLNEDDDESGNGD